MNKTALIQAALTKGIGDVSLRRIIKQIEANGYSYDTFDDSPTEIMAEAGIKSELIQNFYSAHEQAVKCVNELLEQEVQILAENESDYPQYLKQSLQSKCPPILFAKGNTDILNQPAVGFCGSRKASQKGIGIAADCAGQFAKSNISVVSGYASGIDMAAHASALASGGTTVFVLAEGLLRSKIKPDICEYINQKNHVFLTQYLPYSTWNVGNAMKRNATIIGLSRAMILVEAGKTGGTFAAGETALKVGCPLFVIDFEKPEVSAEANPYFIASGGHPIRGKNGIPNLKKVLVLFDQSVSTKEHIALPNEQINEQLRITI